MSEIHDSDMLRFMPFPFEAGRFPAALGGVVQLTVLRGDQPARIVVHANDGSWMVGDGVNDPNEPGASLATHILHVVRDDPSLEQLASLPPGKMAQRSSPAETWQVTDHIWEDDEETP